jgi:hypothetical protein
VAPQLVVGHNGCDFGHNEINLDVTRRLLLEILSSP